MAPALGDAKGPVGPRRRRGQLPPGRRGIEAREGVEGVLLRRGRGRRRRGRYHFSFLLLDLSQGREGVGDGGRERGGGEFRRRRTFRCQERAERRAPEAQAKGQGRARRGESVLGLVQELLCVLVPLLLAAVAPAAFAAPVYRACRRHRLLEQLEVLVLADPGPGHQRPRRRDRRAGRRGDGAEGEVEVELLLVGSTSFCF